MLSMGDIICWFTENLVRHLMIKCTKCNGSRLKKESQSVLIDKKNLGEISAMPIINLLENFESIKLSRTDQQISSQILKEIINRLNFLKDVGLGYLTLDRSAATLSGAILFFFKVLLTSEINSSGSVPRSHPTPTAMVLGW